MKRDYEINEMNEINENPIFLVYFVHFVYFVISFHFLCLLPKVVVVVSYGCANYLERVNPSIHFSNTRFLLFSRDELVCLEVMLKSLHEHGRHITDVACITPD